MGVSPAERTVPVTDVVEKAGDGRLAHVRDPAGTRVELWQPLDDGYPGEPRCVDWLQPQCVDLKRSSGIDSLSCQ